MADTSHRGGQWVTPGCIVGLCYSGEDEARLHVVSSMPTIDTGGHSVTNVVSPLSKLAEAILGVEVGAKVRYETPRGLREVTVTTVLD